MPPVLESLTKKLLTSGNLEKEEVIQAVNHLISEEISAESKATFLKALAAKGETIEEISEFADQLRKKAVSVPLDENTRKRELLDVCGTGGDHQNTFNISTTVSLVCASAGVTVCKHGNRAITSKSGSYDVLKALGIATELSPEIAATWLRDHYFAFLFAPAYHPTFKHIAPARKICAAEGKRTLFNFLGPLLNPARPTAQLIGVPDPKLCERISEVLQTIGIRRGMVVCGRIDDACMDELSTLGENTIAEFTMGRALCVSLFNPKNLPVQVAASTDLQGGDSSENAAIIKAILSGKDRGPKRDAILLNSGAALYIADAASSITQGWEQAADLIDSGKATEKLNELIEASNSL
ncbi:MAG TPA: anthranilate phosphoribosyltransferase [Verrucomicrobiales bacterium]|nr:anthranilate phosphoribosyltransferase [Verrucomicrobiales bacterium]